MVGIAPTALANLTMTGSLPYNFPPNMTPTMGGRDASQSLDQSSGYPSPRHTRHSILDVHIADFHLVYSLNLYRLGLW